MKVLITMALVATSLPVVAVAAEGANNQVSRDGRICRQVTTRTSASRMGPRRVCKTASQWRALDDGTVADDMEALDVMTRTQGRPVPTLGRSNSPR